MKTDGIFHQTYSSDGTGAVQTSTMVFNITQFYQNNPSEIFKKSLKSRRDESSVGNTRQIPNPTSHRDESPVEKAENVNQWFILPLAGIFRGSR